jgi:hypothetical protein
MATDRLGREPRQPFAGDRPQQPPADLDRLRDRPLLPALVDQLALEPVGEVDERPVRFAEAYYRHTAVVADGLAAV